MCIIKPRYGNFCYFCINIHDLNRVQEMKEQLNLDWANLPFGYVRTDYNVRCYYRDGKWGDIEVTD